MFLDRFRRSTSTAAVLVEEVPVVAPTRIAAQPRFDDNIRREYVEKATTLGVVNGALKQEMLLALLRENGICIYPYEKVEAYLDKVFGRCHCKKPYDHYRCATWGWRPLREEDDRKLTSDDEHVPNGQIMRGTYQQAVPLPVLLTVEKIAATVPGVHFYVSDQVRPGDGDPFLGVSAVGMNMQVIERWDEPSFRA